MTLMNTIRLTLIMTNFEAGGAQRVMTIMVNYWAEKGWIIHVFVLNGEGKPPFYPLHPDVIWQDLDLSKPLGNPFSAVIRMRERLRRLRLAIQQTSPDTVISFNDETNVITLLATRGLRVPVIVSERNDPHCHAMKNPWRSLRPWTYRQAASVVSQTQYALEYFSGSIRSRGRVIPNPVIRTTEIGEIHGQHSPKHRGTTILAMGRLDWQKGFDLLIEAFAKVSARHHDCTLEIWGEGQERGNLEKMIADKGLEEWIKMPGVTKVPYEKMRQADLFVLSSRYEGFPNVLCEAMACGMPVVSFNCHSGPSEIVRDGIDGILVSPEDTSALADALYRLLTDETERKRLAARAIEIAERFGIDNIMDQWTRLIIELSGIKTVAPMVISSPGKIHDQI
jgi:GalNAc-alpha-(1->4)-GalNAc-alpha-(1->3)-diNAcBac-PP-undecaprenol alpha-1,4-N-acetyl-D-galactosaminyltransferase